MWQESGDPPKGEKPAALRTGLTTGSCATACCVAAAMNLLSQQSPHIVSITLPSSKARKTKTVELVINDYQVIDNGVRTNTTKDAGDDPDVTHGATVFVELKLTPQLDIQFKAASGVGTVTRDGLLLEVGEPAINPVPRKMMIDNLEKLAQEYQYEGGFIVAVGIENGEAIAQKTMNPRLGIVGGLSVLGTTGIVRPFSCAAWIASIYQGIDVADANGYTHIAASTGNSSEATIKDHYQLSDMALIEMGDFAGAVLKHLKKLALNNTKIINIKKLSICGGFGKISKLAQGHMDLNSRASSIDFDFLISVAKDLGATSVLCDKIKQSNTSIEALKHCQNHQIDLAQALCLRALNVAQKVIPKSIDVEVMAIDRHGQFVASTQSVINNKDYN
jgi:cobalt-precorrin-5B (C1)-methyltransferase